jgi:hypothetical protein
MAALEFTNAGKQPLLILMAKLLDARLTKLQQIRSDGGVFQIPKNPMLTRPTGISTYKKYATYHAQTVTTRLKLNRSASTVNGKKDMVVTLSVDVLCKKSVQIVLGGQSDLDNGNATDSNIETEIASFNVIHSSLFNHCQKNYQFQKFSIPLSNTHQAEKNMLTKSAKLK